MKKTLLIGSMACLVSCNSQNKSQSLIKSDTSESSMKAKIYNDALQTDYNKALQSDTYKNAWMDVQQIKEDVNLADSSLISKDGVINEFNNGVGQTMGQVKKLSQVKEKLKNIDSTYLKFVALKVSAQIALQKAANANAEVNKLKNQK